MQFNSYIKLGSGKEQVLGKSRDKHHVGWTKVISFHPQINPISAGSVNSESTSIAPALMNVIKWIDNLSEKIAQASATGVHFNTLVCELADQATGLPKQRYDFYDVEITDYALGSGDPPRDAFSFSFARWSVNQNPIPDDSAQLMLKVMARLLQRH
jgi:type VI protein secretion system component Hcp